MPVRVTGPIGRTTDRTLDHPVLLIFAGGVGVSFHTFSLCLLFTHSSVLCGARYTQDGCMRTLGVHTWMSILLTVSLGSPPRDLLVPRPGVPDAVHHPAAGGAERATGGRCRFRAAAARAAGLDRAPQDRVHHPRPGGAGRGRVSCVDQSPGSVVRICSSWTALAWRPKPPAVSGGVLAGNKQSFFWDVYVAFAHATVLVSTLQGWRWVADHRSPLHWPQSAGGDLDAAHQVRDANNLHTCIACRSAFCCPRLHAGT